MTVDEDFAAVTSPRARLMVWAQSYPSDIAALNAFIAMSNEATEPDYQLAQFVRRYVLYRQIVK